MRSEDFVLYAEECLKIPTIYIWGGIGEFLTEELILEKANLYPEVYTREYQQRLCGFVGKGIRGFDCSGLINHFRMGGLKNFHMRKELDWNSSMLWEKAERKGAIEGMPEVKGVCLFLPGHVGIYAGDGRVIEATNNPKFGDGVVETRIKDRAWTGWFYCPLVCYES